MGGASPDSRNVLGLRQEEDEVWDREHLHGGEEDVDTCSLRMSDGPLVSSCGQRLAVTHLVKHLWCKACDEEVVKLRRRVLISPLDCAKLKFSTHPVARGRHGLADHSHASRERLGAYDPGCSVPAYTVEGGPDIEHGNAGTATSTHGRRCV